MNKCQQINQDSGNVEYYTPPEIIEAARQVLGFIDLDPASSVIANQTVKAAEFFTAADDGLSKPWYGRVWMNHPFSRANNAAFVKKLVREYTMSRNVEAACCITYAATSEEWFRPLLAFPQCYIHGRTNYYKPDGTKTRDVSKGSVVTYLGPDVAGFKKAFSQIGTVKI